MKTLLLIRHAKSSWHNSDITDFERPLNERGKFDAPEMAKKLRDKEIFIDTFISSPAKRTKKTAEIFMDEFDVQRKGLILIPSLYEATVNNFYNSIEELKEKMNIVALFAHNPGITDFINSLECYNIYDMPTCGIFAIKIKTEKWKYIKDANKEFLFFDYPKNQ